jgi:hypothetical protein
VQGIDDLLNRGIPVPEVEVEDVDVVRLEVLQGEVDGVAERLGTVARVGGTGDRVRGEMEVVGVLQKVSVGEYEVDMV